MNFLSRKPSKTQAEVKISDSDNKFEIVVNQNSCVKLNGKNMNDLVHFENGNYDIRINDISVRQINI